MPRAGSPSHFLEVPMSAQAEQQGGSITSLPIQLAPGCCVSACLFPGSSSGWTSVKWQRMATVQTVHISLFQTDRRKIYFSLTSFRCWKKWCQQTDSEDDCKFLWERIYSFSWSLRIWTWKARQEQVALSFQYSGSGRTGSSRNCDGQRDPTVTPCPWAAAQEAG